MWLTRQTLVHQIIHRNVLTLQYNCLVLEKAEEELRTADQFVGYVRARIRQSGITTASEYAMREDYSFHTTFSGKAQINSSDRVYFTKCSFGFRVRATNTRC